MALLSAAQLLELLDGKTCQTLSHISMTSMTSELHIPISSFVVSEARIRGGSICVVVEVSDDAHAGHTRLPRPIGIEVSTSSRVAGTINELRQTKCQFNKDITNIVDRAYGGDVGTLLEDGRASPRWSGIANNGGGLEDRRHLNRPTGHESHRATHILVVVRPPIQQHSHPTPANPLPNNDREVEQSNHSDEDPERDCSRIIEVPQILFFVIRIVILF